MTQATRSALMSVATTLAANIDATQDYIPVASTANFSTSVVAEVESTNEVVSFTDISSNLITYSEQFDNAAWSKKYMRRRSTCCRYPVISSCSSIGSYTSIG